ncbi:pilin [Candidatus Kaiserbacteria bacterium]|nr:pilin [Candidatus Kaiserbacteria bacterium]
MSKFQLPIFLTTFFLLFFVQTASAQFNPLAPIPGITDTQTDLVGYIERFFYLAIFIGGILAVLRITVAGIKYMLTDVVSSKSEARKDILGAFMGIGILLVSVLILTTINPNLLNLEVLDKAEPITSFGTKDNGQVIEPVPPTKKFDTNEEAEQYKDSLEASGACPEGFEPFVKKETLLSDARAGCDSPYIVDEESYPVVDPDSNLYDDWEDLGRPEKIGHIEETAGKVNALVDDCNKQPGFRGKLIIPKTVDMPWWLFGTGSAIEDVSGFVFSYFEISTTIETTDNEVLNKARDMEFLFTCEYVG